MPGRLSVTAAMSNGPKRSCPTVPSPTGVFNAIMTFSSRGLSPLGLVSGLTGSGSIDLGQARFAHLTPAAAESAIDMAMRSAPDALQAALRQRLAAGSAATIVTIGPRLMPFDVAEGTVRLRPVAIELNGGRVFVEARADLANFGFTGEWRVETSLAPPAGTAKAAVALPPIAFRYAGPLGKLGRIEPSLSSDRLEQEIAVRKLERDVDDLERLRKLDEERAKEGLEKRTQASQGAVQGSLPIGAVGTFGTLTVVPAPAIAAPDGSTLPIPIPDPPAIQAPVAATPRDNNPSPSIPSSIPSAKFKPLAPEEMRRIFGGG